MSNILRYLPRLTDPEKEFIAECVALLREENINIESVGFLDRDQVKRALLMQGLLSYSHRLSGSDYDKLSSEIRRKLSWRYNVNLGIMLFIVGVSIISFSAGWSLSDRGCPEYVKNSIGKAK